ncbi:hypothetical protein OB934_19600 [Aeromonas salmonicida]|uniref:hypothetical protein n=1 Tax=Aeromonas salmonicida TaxID=645 RepID=UPI00259F6314|nr:hypothetical protein [Aeromonas salmonicida]MDM5064990.1 hypothetical protein [Aeromonas salmonicida]
MIQYGFEHLVLLGSAGYQRAELPLDASVSLIAPNNTGKTSLINALQFLLIIDQRAMDFGAHDREKSRRFYFPNNSSYILLQACLPQTGTVVLGCVGKGVSHDYQYFAYKGELELDDYRLEDGNLVAEPQLVSHLASCQRLVTIYKHPSEFRDALYGSRKKRSDSEPDFTLFHLEHQSDADAYRRVLTQTLRLDKLTSGHVKKYLLEIFKRDLTDAAIDFKQEWEKAFSEVNSERAQYQAALEQAKRIEELAERVETRLAIRGKIVAWRPKIEEGLQQWQTYYQRRLEELADNVRQHKEEQGQQQSRDRELTLADNAKKQERNVLAGQDEQQNALGRRFTLYSGRGQLETQLTSLQVLLEKQITLLGQAKGRSVKAIKLDLEQRQAGCQSLREQKKTLADNLYRRLSSQLSEPELSRLNRVLQSGVMGLGPQSFDLDVSRLQKQLAQSPADALELAGLRVSLAGLSPQFQQMSEVELDERIRDTEREIASLLEQLQVAEKWDEAEAYKQQLEQDKKQLEQELAEFDTWQKLLAQSDERTAQIAVLNADLDLLKAQLDASVERGEQLQNKINALTQEQDKLAWRHTRIEAERSRREDLGPMFSNLKDRPHHPWLGEPEWTLDHLDERLQNYQADCRQLQELHRTLQLGLQSLHAGGLTKFQFSEGDDVEWAKILDFHRILPKEKEALEKRARSAVISVVACLKQLKQGLEAFKGRMRDFNRLISQRQLSDLKVFKIEARDDIELVKAIDTLLSTAAQVDSGESFDLFNQQSILDNDDVERAKKYLFDVGNRQQGLRVEDLFGLEFVIGKQDMSEESFEDIDSAASHGTVLMAKLVTGLAMLYLMQHKAKKIRTVCYLDEALALDSRNQKSLIDIAEQFGFALICASPAPLATARYCVPIHHRNGKNHINRQSWQILLPRGLNS